MVRTASLIVLAVTLGACGEHASTGPIISNGESSVFWDAGREAIRRGKEGSLDTIAVQVTMVDRYGAESLAPALTFSWAAEDVRRANWAKMSPTMAVDLASMRIDGREGLNSLRAWCDTDASTLRICGQERDRATTAYWSQH